MARRHRGEIRALVAILIVMAMTFVPLAGRGRPGLGGYAGPAMMRAGAGGLVIDYSRARKAALREDVVVSLTTDGITISSGRQHHELALTQWERADLLSTVLEHDNADAYLEVSVDTTGIGERNFAASPQLMRGGAPSPVGVRLQRADLAYAELVGGGTWAKDEYVQALAPLLVSLRMLDDPDERAYRLLARDLALPPTPWPQIRLFVGPLTEARPVTWKTDFQLIFRAPDGEHVDADGTFLTKDMVRQALRPYEPLQQAVEGRDESNRDRIRARFPLLADAERYAVALAAFDAHCRTERAMCAAWLRDAAGAPAPTESVTDGTEDDEEAAIAATLGSVAHLKRWGEVRLDVAQQERNAEYRRWIFVDETIFAMANGARWPDETLLALLPGDRYGKGETAAAVRLCEALVRLGGADAAGLEQAARQVLAVLGSIQDGRLPAASKTFWAERAAAAIIQLAGRSGPVGRLVMPKGNAGSTGVGAEIAHKVSEIYGRCYGELAELADTALRDPESRRPEDWLLTMGRLQRCRLAAVGPELRTGYLVLEAVFHYAVGVGFAAERAHRRDALDRLRVVLSYADILKEDPIAYREIRTLASDLERRVARR